MFVSVLLHKNNKYNGHTKKCAIRSETNPVHHTSALHQYQWIIIAKPWAEYSVNNGSYQIYNQAIIKEKFRLCCEQWQQFFHGNNFRNNFTFDCYIVGHLHDPSVHCSTRPIISPQIWLTDHSRGGMRVGFTLSADEGRECSISELLVLIHELKCQRSADSFV